MRKPNTYCNNCNIPLYRRPIELVKFKNIYCNDCKNHRITQMSDIATKLNNARYLTYIEKWKMGKVTGMRGKYSISHYIVRYLFEKYNNKCSKCGWNEVNQYTGKIPLETEHIDGDYTNNKEENLDLLCPNCHSLTPTYKGANRGNGRKERKCLPE
jgi:Zn finger protein HypA/HybF involved in hydrogenase expression